MTLSKRTCMDDLKHLHQKQVSMSIKHMYKRMCTDDLKHLHQKTSVVSKKHVY